MPKQSPKKPSIYGELRYPPNLVRLLQPPKKDPIAKLVQYLTKLSYLYCLDSNWCKAGSVGPGHLVPSLMNNFLAAGITHQLFARASVLGKFRSMLFLMNPASRIQNFNPVYQKKFDEVTVHDILAMAERLRVGGINEFDRIMLSVPGVSYDFESVYSIH